MQEYSYSGNVLTIEGQPLHEIAGEFGTPLYVYSRKSILDHCRSIERSFDGYDHLTCYAVKANSNKRILELIAGEGLGADVGSRGELSLALHAGFPPEQITFSGVGKRDDEISFALKERIAAFNVESVEEIEIINSIAAQTGGTARIRLRVNLDIQIGGHEYVSTSVKQSKFGIPLQEAVPVLRWAKSLPNIELGGIHSHIGSQITKADTFLAAARALNALLSRLRAEGSEVHDLDFGGGFGVQYKGYVVHPALPEEEPEEINLSASTLIKTVLPALKESNCRISIQPGRSIIAHAGVLLTKVLHRKQTDDKVFVVVDGGMNDLIRPSLYHSYHQIVPLALDGSPHEKVDVVGPLCETGDFFAMDRVVPRVKRGDLLAVMCTGAYGYVLASNYNARPRPAEILVDGTVATIIRPRETIEQLENV